MEIPQRASSRRTIATRGVVFEVIGFGASQIIRLASTLVLSRLLFPEAFGLAGLLTVFIVGLNMLSDAGIEQGVVRSPRGGDRSFLNTAWTISAVRGILLWGIACALAWPMASVYNEPLLRVMIPIGALGVLVSGFASTSLMTLRRTLSLGRLIGVEIFSQVVAVGTTISWAFVDPTVWAIVGGTLAGACMRAIVSHALSVGYRNRFEWHSEAAGQIFHFGKWIFASSSLSFLSRQADRFMLGHFAGMATLGIYTMATLIGEAAGVLATRITAGVLYPAMSGVARETPDRLRDVFYRARLRSDAVGQLPLGALCVLAPLIIDVLYDDRYQEAGWMLQLLTIRVSMSITLEAMKDCLLARGLAQYGFYQNLTRSIWIVIAITVGWNVYGVPGVILAAALSELPVYPVTVFAMYKHSLLRPARELLTFGYFLAGAMAGLLMVEPAGAVFRFLGVIQ